MKKFLALTVGNTSVFAYYIEAGDYGRALDKLKPLTLPSEELHVMVEVKDEDFVSVDKDEFTLDNHRILC